MSSFRLFPLLAFLLPVLPGHAALTAWRTEVQASAGSGVGTQFAFGGGLNEPSSSVLLNYLSAESQSASALADRGFLPTLQARATNEGTRAQAVAWAVQGFTHTGTVPLDTSLVLNLTADVTGANDLNANLYLFQEEGFQFYQDPGTMLFESSSQLWPGFEPFTNNLGPEGFDISVRDFTGAVSEVRSFDFTVQPGESFYVWARLVATADNLGEADAYSTLTASFTNTDGLSPAAIPEPGAPVLLLLAAGGTLFLRRRARR